MYCNDEFARALVLQVLMKQHTVKEEFSISICPWKVCTMQKCILVIRVNYGILGVINPFLFVDAETKWDSFCSFYKNIFQLKTYAEDEKLLLRLFGAPVIVWCCIQKVLQFLLCVMCVVWYMCVCVCVCVCLSERVCVRVRVCACVVHSIVSSYYNCIALQLQWNVTVKVYLLQPSL
jgi:hypothetical protein